MAETMEGWLPPLLIVIVSLTPGTPPLQVDQLPGTAQFVFGTGGEEQRGGRGGHDPETRRTTLREMHVAHQILLAIREDS
jgi:hypothetical protein